MATIQAQLLFDEINSVIVVKDTTDYVAQGIDPANVKGYIQISGTTTYNNIGGATPDIDPAIAQENNIPIPLPLGDDGRTKQGAYTLRYVVQQTLLPITDPPVIAESEFTVTVNNTYKAPEICLEQDWNCTNSTFTSEDVTQYPVNISITTTVHKILPPLGSNKVEQTVNLLTNIYLGITTGTWQSYIKNTITVTLQPGVYILQDLEATKTTKDITCDTSLCKILCCINDIYAEAEAAECKSGAYVSPHIIKKQKLATEYLIRFLAAERCGNQELASQLLKELKAKTGCNDDCKCNGSQPMAIIPQATAGMMFIVDSPNNTINVTATQQGNTITYHLELPAAIVAIINSLVPIVVEADPSSAGIITVTEVPGNPKKYLVGFSGSLWTEQVVKVQIDCTKNLTPPGFATIDKIDYVVSPQGLLNNTLTPAANHIAEAYPNGNSNIGTDIAIVKYYGWRGVDGASKPFHVHQTFEGRKVDIFPNDVYSVNTELTFTHNTSTHDFIFIRFISPVDGHPLTWNEVFAGANAIQNGIINLTITLQ